MMLAKIELHIEELILRGFAPGDRYRIDEAVERELARLLAEEGVPPWLAQGGNVARLDSGSFQVAPGSRPEEIGAKIAQALYGGPTR